MGEDKAPSLRLQPIRERAALLIAEGWSQVKVAEKIERTAQTVNKWCKHDDEFMQRVEILRADIPKQANERLAESLPEAVDSIIQIAKFGGAPGVVASRLRAAMYIVELANSSKVQKITRRPGSREAVAEGMSMTEAEAKEMLEKNA